MEWNKVTTGGQIEQSFLKQWAAFFGTITKQAFDLSKENAYSATYKLHPAKVLTILLATCFNTDLLGNIIYWNIQWYSIV